MSELFLGLIAAAVLVMAAIHVAAVLIAARLARRLDQFADRLEEDLRPVVASLQALTADAARATSVFKAFLNIFRGPQKASAAAAAEEEGPLFIG